MAMLNNKWDFYLFLMNHNIPTPKTVLFDYYEKGSISFPVITKPLDSENSDNVIKSENLSQLSQVPGKTNKRLLSSIIYSWLRY